MPTITYTGPDALSPRIETGPASYLVLPADLAVEVSEEVAMAVSQQHPGENFVITGGPAPAPAKKR